MHDEKRTDDPIRYWHSLSSPELGALIEKDPVAVLPLAAIEQHGPHLPLSTDLDIAMGLVRGAFRRLPSDFPALVLPALAVGASDEHMDLPGTLTVGTDLMTDLVRARGEDVSRTGIRRLVLLNAHGGNRAALESAGLTLRREEGLVVVKADYFRFPRPPDIELPPSEWRRGIHGGAVETAMMLHLCPDDVRLDRVADFESVDSDLEDDLERLTAGGPLAFSWLARDLHESGVVGDARLATARLGERLVAHYGTVLAELIRDARTFSLDRLR